LVLFTVMLAVTVFAHGDKHSGQHRPENRSFPAIPAAKPVTVSGNLIIANGSPAIKSEDTTYIIGRSFRLFGMIDGLKEGALVTIEGRAMGTPRDSKLMVLLPSKLTINGKTYDNLEPAGFPRNFPSRRAPENHRPSPYMKYRNR